MKKFTKIALIVASFVLVAALSVGGTLAWLQASTTVVTNTFSPTNITVNLEETKPTGKQAQIIPAVDIEKDPKVTAEASENVAYYVFVKVTEINWNANLTYRVADAWTELAGVTGLEEGEKVYYKTVAAGEKVDEYILKDNKVYVADEMNVEDMPASEAKPQLTFKAYAIQQVKDNSINFTELEAWNQVKTLDNTSGDSTT